MRRTISRLRLPFREPFVTASGVFAARDLLLLRLEDDDGVFGYGEAAPFEPYDGVSIDATIDALLGSVDVDQVPPQASAAEEMAALDLEARRLGQTIGEPGADAIAVNCTLAGASPEEVAARASDALRAGYACFKLKVGLPNDVERVAAVREAIGPWPALRLDANGSWSVEEAVALIAALEPYDIQLVEQPCATLAELAMVRRIVAVPIAADESIRTPGDVRTAAASEACDIVCVKLATAGGFGAARRTLRTAADEGLQAYLSSMLDGPWGIAAALQLAATERVSLACGLATLGLFDAALADALPAPADGLLPVPQGPGLGVTIDDGAIAAVLVGELD